MEVAQNHEALPPAGGQPHQGGPVSHGIAHQMALPAPEQATGLNDFWDVGDPGFAGAQLPQDHEFSELVQVSTDRQRTKPLVVVLLVVVLAAAGFGAYEFFVEDKNPLDVVVAFVNGLGGEEQPVEAPQPAPLAKPVKVAKVKAKPKPGTRLKAIEGNPYWSLPNAIVGPTAPMAHLWSPEDEETLRAGLTHKYAYQRWKTVLEVRRRRLKGSETILWDAMQDKKFWTRMQAAIGLADFGTEVSLQSLEGALAKARSELVSTFFERFARHPSPGQLFVLRQVVRVLDERGRLVVLQGIWKSKDALRDLYMTAATQDPGPRVKAWVREALLERPVQPDRYNELLQIVRGKASGDDFLAEVKAAKKKAKKQQRDVRVKTQDDIDREMAEGGGVEFYDDVEPKAKADDKADPETYEYAE